MAYCLTRCYLPEREPPRIEISAEQRGTIDSIPYIPNVSQMMAGVRISETTIPKPSWLPTHGLCVSGHKKLPDIFYADDCCCVSQRFKDVIELFDTGRHQFFPLTIESRRKLFPEEIVYFFNICIIKDRLSAKASGLLATDVETIYFIPKVDNKRILKTEDRSGHVWRERLHIQDIYISDECYEAAIAVGVKCLASSRYVIRTEPEQQI